MSYRLSYGHDSTLKSLSICPSFGRFLYNPARVADTTFRRDIVNVRGHPNLLYRAVKDLNGIPSFNANDNIAFGMVGSVINTWLTESIVLPSKTGRNYHQRGMLIRPLSGELQRAMNTVACIWDVRTIGMSIRDDGISFTTLPSPSRYRKFQLSSSQSTPDLHYTQLRNVRQETRLESRRCL